MRCVIAYVDESYQQGVYVLAAVLAHPEAATARHAILDTRLRRQAVIHFVKENPKRRLQLAETVARLGLPVVAAVRLSQERPERARGRCLHTLSWALASRASRIVIEDRQRTLNRHDRSVLTGPRHQPAPSPMFVAKPDEPLLWAADIVAGALFHDLARSDPTYRAALGQVELYLA